QLLKRMSDFYPRLQSGDLLLCAKHLFVNARRGLRELHREHSLHRHKSAARRRSTDSVAQVRKHPQTLRLKRGTFMDHAIGVVAEIKYARPETSPTNLI